MTQELGGRMTAESVTSGSDERKSAIPIMAWITLGILFLALLVYFLDKQIFALLVTLLQADLGFSDTEIGLLQGFAFAIPNAVGFIVAGILADKYSRKRLLAAGIVFWSLAAAASGLAWSFESMAVARALVGFGEAAMIPVGLSLLATVFPRDRLALAVGIFYAGPPVGGIIAVLLGGAVINALVQSGGVAMPILGHLSPWQAAFVLTGLPGLLVAFLILQIPVDDGRRRREAIASEPSADGVSLKSFVRTHKAFLLTHSLAFALSTILSMTVLSWAPAYLGRTYAWDHSTIGVVLACGMAGGALGNILWGHVADRLRRRGHQDAIYRIYTVLPLAGFVVAAIAFNVNQLTVFLPAFVALNAIVLGMGGLMVPLQLAAPDQLRGRLTGMYAVFTVVIGLGLGPGIAGFLTDHLFHDRAMLGAAIVLTLGVVSVGVSALLIFGRKAYLRALNAQDSAVSGAALPASA